VVTKSNIYDGLRYNELVFGSEIIAFQIQISNIWIWNTIFWWFNQDVSESWVIHVVCMWRMRGREILQESPIYIYISSYRKPSRYCRG